MNYRQTLRNIAQLDLLAAEAYAVIYPSVEAAFNEDYGVAAVWPIVALTAICSLHQMYKRNRREGRLSTLIRKSKKRREWNRQKFEAIKEEYRKLMEGLDARV